MSGVNGLEQRVIQLRGGGRLTVRQDGRLVQMQVSRADDGCGLYKVWIRGAGGRLLLGTLAPEDGCLRLHCRLAIGQLERAGCWPVTGGESVLTFSFERSQWTREWHPDRLVKDMVLKRVISGQTVLLRRQEGGFCLAVPFDPVRPFPLEPLFCLGEVRRVEGRLHAVFSFDRTGTPVAPHNARDCGENSGTSQTKEESPWQYSPPRN